MIDKQFTNDSFVIYKTCFFRERENSGTIPINDWGVGEIFTLSTVLNAIIKMRVTSILQDCGY